MLTKEQEQKIIDFTNQKFDVKEIKSIKENKNQINVKFITKTDRDITFGLKKKIFFKEIEDVK